MNKLLLSLLVLFGVANCQPVFAQSTAKVLGTCGTATYTAGTTNYQTMDTAGNQCSSGGGGGGGGAITAASGAYASGSISAGAEVDIGTGSSPAANTVNSNLKIINTTLGSPLQAGGQVQPIAGSTGGATPKSIQVANNTTSIAVDASAGTVYEALVFNNSATIAYLKLYNAAQGSTTCGSGTPVQRIMIPANTSGAGAVISFGVGIAYGTAITACITTGYGDSDTTAPAASTYIVEVDYK